MIIYLIQLRFSSEPNARQTFVHRDATIPEDQPRKLSGSTDRLSSLCFVLHRMGFFLPRKLLRER